MPCADRRLIAYQPLAADGKSAKTSDFGETGDRTLQDKIVKAAKLHAGVCHDCAGDIAKGELHRHRVDIFDGEMMALGLKSGLPRQTTSGKPFVYNDVETLVSVSENAVYGNK
mgnify:CR=1 FL=1